MPYSFTQIEKDKSFNIGLVFFFLCIFYVLFLGAAAILLKLSWLAFWDEEIRIFFPFFKLSEWFGIFFTGTVAAVLHHYCSMVNLSAHFIRWVAAKEPDPKDEKQKELLNIVEEVSVATGGAKFRVFVIPDSSLNACAIDDGSSLPLIAVTDGALHRLTRAQLEAVIAHEAAHILRGDCSRATTVTAMFEIYTLAIKSWLNPRMISYSSTFDVEQRRLFNPLFYVFQAILGLFCYVTSKIALIMRMFITREAKLRADAIAVRLTRDPLSLAQAIRILANNWRGLGSQWEMLEGVFFVNPQQNFLDEREGIIPDFFSTHPPITQRLAILLDMAKSTPEELEAHKKLADEKFNQEQVRKAPFELREISFKKNICPTCQVDLKPLSYEYQDILKCSTCHGVLANEDQVGVILAMKEAVLRESIKVFALKIKEQQVDSFVHWEQLNQKQNRYRCPHCNTGMWTRPFNTIYHVMVDKCVICGYMWFDSGEIELLQALYELRNPTVK